MQSQQIRGVLPRTVTPVSLRYPQLLCVLEHFSRKIRKLTPRRTIQRAPNRLDRVNDAAMPRRIPHRFGTRDGAASS
jgi:hypothetical protein